MLEDSAYNFPKELSPLHSLDNSSIVDICSNPETNEILVLLNSGILISHRPLNADPIEPWDLNVVGQDGDKSWFCVQAIGETGALICISHSGFICSVQKNKLTDAWNEIPESEGCVGDGLGHAMWSPDQTCLVLATNNSSLLLMTNTFDVINEVPIESRQSGSLCSLSWNGDGLQFALYSVDSSDGIGRIRLYSRDLVLLHESRTAADGPASIVKNLLPCIAYAGNGSMIAAVQQKTPKKQQVSNVLLGIDIAAPIPY